MAKFKTIGFGPKTQPTSGWSVDDRGWTAHSGWTGHPAPKPEIPTTIGNRRGRPSVERDRVVRRMMKDIESGRLTKRELAAMKEVVMSAGYKTSRRTARDARKIVLAGSKL